MVSLGTELTLADSTEASNSQGEIWTASVPQVTQGLCQPGKAELANGRSFMQKPAAAAAFATLFVDRYLAPAFEIDLLVLGSLIKAGALDPGAPVYDFAMALDLTPTRVRSLTLNSQLRTSGQGLELRRALVQALGKTLFAKDGSLLAFRNENPMLREEVEARLKRRGIFASASFSREIVCLPVETFVELLDHLVDAAAKRELCGRIVDDHQLQDRSFKAIAASLPGELAEKVTSKAGEAIAGELLVPSGTRAAEGVTDRVRTFLPIIKQARGFRQLLLRGIDKVCGEWATTAPPTTSQN